MSKTIPNIGEEIKLLIDKINTLTVLYKEAQKEIVLLKENQQETDDQMAIQEQSDRLQELITQGNEHIKQLFEDKAGLQKERDEAQSQVEGQQSVIQFLNQDVNQLRDTLEEKDETIDIFNQQKRDFIKENQKLKDELVELRKLSKMADSLKKEKEEILHEKEELSTEIELLNEEIERLSK
ncbi:hypothetical protein [Flammeovirga pacifica]|uniref:Uncharacterized protein n=1 Tax=Flammeovirga pacifica TaxID=915059 RepID=A0A1S1YZ90_FLAPC|nr:hypothetical protein [Flammeovirga pacifica]OHX66331.1 hypothetical protein NH26_08180 [Flammeovirga pacifica]